MLFIPLHGSLTEAARYQEECLHVPPQESRMPLQIICTRDHLFESAVLCEETIRSPGNTGNITACLNDTGSNPEPCQAEGDYSGSYTFGSIQPY